PKGAPALPPDSERLLAIYPVIKKHNLLVYVHLGEGQKESFENALELFPAINFIWHGDQLIHNDENGEQVLDNIEEILSAHKNAYYGVDELYGDTWLLRPEVSKDEFLAHFNNYETLLKKDLKTWKGFIERHPDQVLWGTDRGWSTVWSLDQDVAITLNNYSRAFIGKLDPSVQEKFAYKNAEKLIEK
ncbi:amidohydrolase family protein, partial [Candidatus Peregrinibacteria bacterium]|nr:amidohydrolase family protein [Candidatus Peregrinibacteria bacterium]